MAGQFSQIDAIADGSGPPDVFIQLRFPTGDVAEGKVFFYAPDSGNTSVMVHQATMDLSTATPAYTFDGGDGYTYYTYDLTTHLTVQEISKVIDQAGVAGADKVNSVVHTNTDGDTFDDIDSVVAFGNQPGSGADSVTYVDGPLDQKQLKDIDEEDFFEGEYTNGYDPALIIDPDGNIVVGPADPDAPSCFLTGTLISTPKGDIAVQDLGIGDLVTTHDGRSVPVVWVGHVSIMWPFTPAERLMPVRISAHAFGPGIPRRDLTVTTDHAFLIDGILVHASALVNDVTVQQLGLQACDAKMVFWHIETEAHEVILAEGMPAESFIDNVSRRSFDNFDEYERLYGVEKATMKELPFPRAMSKRQRPQRLTK